MCQPPSAPRMSALDTPGPLASLMVNPTHTPALTPAHDTCEIYDLDLQDGQMSSVVEQLDTLNEHKGISG